MSDKTTALDWIKTKFLDHLFSKEPSLRLAANTDFKQNIRLLAPTNLRARKGHPNTNVSVKVEGYPGLISYQYDREKIADICHPHADTVFELPDITPESYATLLPLLGIPEEEVTISTVNRVQGQRRVRISAKGTSYRYVGSAIIRINALTL